MKENIIGGESKIVAGEYIPLTEIFRLFNDNCKQIRDSYSQVKSEDKPISKIQQKYIPQIGDRVHVKEGQFKGITGEIIAEVEGYDKYQIKVDEFNAIYVPKDSVVLIKKKDDILREETIKKLKHEIHNTKTEQHKLIAQLDGIDFKLDNLYKQLEQYGIYNEFCF